MAYKKTPIISTPWNDPFGVVNGVNTILTVVDKVKGENSSNKNSSGNSSSVPSASDSYKNALDDYYKEMMADMRRQQREAEREMRRKINQGVNKLEAQKPLLENQFQDSAQQAYIQYMQSQKKLPQMLAAQGLSGGASESSMVGLESDYGNNVNTLRDSYNQALRDIDSDIADLRAPGGLAIAENAGTYSQKIADLAAQQKLEQLEMMKGFGNSIGSSTGSNKKTLSFQQALDLLSSGVDSQNAKDVYKSYTGVDYFPTRLSEEGQIFADAMENRVNSNPGSAAFTQQQLKEQIAYAIQSQLDTGRITPFDAQFLARKYGINIA